ncbi:MAG: helicase [Parachlamydia sp.]|nr:MAG: helicase [Parachlamydia sp.]
MLNFRKLKKDYSPAILNEGKDLYNKGLVVSAKIINLSPQTVRVSCGVMGTFDNKYQCEIEMSRHDSSTLDSDCDCPYKYDCQHLASVLFYLEEHFDGMVVDYSKETDLEKTATINEKDKDTLRKTFKEAAQKEGVRKGKKQQKELMEEYIGASQVLGQSPFFLPEEELALDNAELAVVFHVPPSTEAFSGAEIQLALRLPFRSKPLIIPAIREFVNAVRYGEPLYIGNKRYYFTLQSFDQESAFLLKNVLDFARYPDPSNDRNQRIAALDGETFGTILAQIYESVMQRINATGAMLTDDSKFKTMPCLYSGSLEEPLRFSTIPANLQFELEYFTALDPKILFKPSLLIDQGGVPMQDARLFECCKPGMILNHTYYRFQHLIKRKHLRNINVIRDITIPEPLFGTFVENSLPELLRFANVTNNEIIEKFVTLPFTGKLVAECDIHYLNGVLEASVQFVYNNLKVPASSAQLTIQEITSFVKPEGILARNLTEEQKILNDLFQDFLFDPAQSCYLCKSDKKIVEFMTEVIPRNQGRVTFNCPSNLLDQFIYDNTKFKLHLSETERMDTYKVNLKVDGYLHGITIDLLWECLSSKKTFIELSRATKSTKKKGVDDENGMKTLKILVLDLEKLAPVVEIFDEIGINLLTNHEEERPLWSLASIDANSFAGLPIEFSMTAKLQEVQQQMLGKQVFNAKQVPEIINAKLREYQIEGVNWLERLRHMHLNGILADDMGLGKTLQAIIAVTQSKIDYPDSIAIVICPTSLVYNWQEEFTKFHPQLRTLPVDGSPAHRKKLIKGIKNYDVVITSYTLLQKDIEYYQSTKFRYCILDEAQHIKNRGTRNAKSVKMLNGVHRLVLTGTPIENSLEELWSLFDFLMPGLLSTFDRFVERYIRNPHNNQGKNLEILRRKVSPFILRRMKSDVLSELPPLSQIVYHCHLSDTQQALYRSYAQSAREELSQLVSKEGFDKVQIHVLATLTRLKQICCHPAIFAKEKAENGDSSKYDMLMELLPTLIEGKHKTVIFSQYTRMLNIIREDLQQQGIPFEYLDGSSKNRLSIVKKFNEDENIPIFLVSLKAGGTGLNLIGADTVIHYDMWWNPAVENQATDRVHRLGQKKSVLSYKLITLGTIEEKILQLQQQKEGHVKKVVSCDEEAIAKLTWEEVLELLQV